MEDGEYICEGCYCESYFTCEECGEVFHIDYARSDEETDENLCPDCYENRQPAGLHSYGFKPHAIFHREQHEEGKPCLYMGIELELSHEDSEDRNRNIEACHTIWKKRRPPSLPTTTRHKAPFWTIPAGLFSFSHDYMETKRYVHHCL